MAKADNFLFGNWVLVYGVVSNCYWFNSPLATSSAAQYLLLLITLNQKNLLGALAEKKNRKVWEFFPIWEFLTDFPLFLPFCGSLTPLLTKFPHVPLLPIPASEIPFTRCHDLRNLRYIHFFRLGIPISWNEHDTLLKITKCIFSFEFLEFQ